MGKYGAGVHADGAVVSGAWLRLGIGTGVGGKYNNWYNLRIAKDDSIGKTLVDVIVCRSHLLNDAHENGVALIGLCPRAHSLLLSFGHLWWALVATHM